jgi:hypothetical protein
MFCLQLYSPRLCSASSATQTSMGDCRPWAQRHSAPPAAGPIEAAGRGPRRKLPGTTWPSHIYRGPTGTRAVGHGERASEAAAPAGRSTRQAGASTSRRHLDGVSGLDLDGVSGLKWTGRGVGSRSDHADVGQGGLGVNRFLSIVTTGQRVQIIDCLLYDPLAVEQRIRCYKKGFGNTAVDQT